MPHLLLIGADPAALEAWRVGLAQAGVPVAGVTSALDAPLRLRRARPSTLVVIEPWDLGEAREAITRCRAAAESTLPVILVLWSSPWLHGPLPADLEPAAVLDASKATAADLIRAARVLAGKPAEAEIDVAGLALDPVERRLRGPNGDAFLTPSEATLLGLLLSHPLDVVRVEEVARALWGTPINGSHERAAIRTHLHTLRRKLASVGAGDAIRSVPGVGYRLTEPPLQRPSQAG